MMKMMHPCTLHQMQMMMQESRKGLEGLEKGLKHDAALKPAPDAPLHLLHPTPDAPDEALQPYIYYMYML